MKKLYNAPVAELTELSTSDVITLSLLDLLDVNDWADGIDVSTLDFTTQQ